MARHAPSSESSGRAVELWLSCASQEDRFTPIITKQLVEESQSTHHAMEINPSKISSEKYNTSKARIIFLQGWTQLFEHHIKCTCVQWRFFFKALTLSQVGEILFAGMLFSSFLLMFSFLTH